MYGFKVKNVGERSVLKDQPFGVKCFHVLLKTARGPSTYGSILLESESRVPHTSMGAPGEQQAEERRVEGSR